MAVANFLSRSQGVVGLGRTAPQPKLGGEGMWWRTVVWLNGRGEWGNGSGNGGNSEVFQSLVVRDMT